MKKSLLVITVLFMALCSFGQRRHYSYQGGHYRGGHGSSHRGGHYVNRRTHNHYTHHRY